MELLFEVSDQISKKEWKTIGKIDGTWLRIISAVLGYFLISTGLLNIFLYHHPVIGIMLIAVELYLVKWFMGYPQFFFERQFYNMWVNREDTVVRCKANRRNKI